MLRLLGIHLVFGSAIAAEVIFSSVSLSARLGSCEQKFNALACSGSHDEFYEKEKTLPTSVCHEDRARRAAMLLRSFVGNVPQHILDLGAGCGDVRRYVNVHDTYTPSDLRTRDFPVIKCDYNAGLFPLPQAWTVVFALGVLEYMCDAKRFVRALRSYNATVILSYTASDLNPVGSVIPLANSMTKAELEKLMEYEGFEIRRRIIPKFSYNTRSSDPFALLAKNLLYILQPRHFRTSDPGHRNTSVIAPVALKPIKVFLRGIAVLSPAVIGPGYDHQ